MAKKPPGRGREAFWAAYLELALREGLPLATPGRQLGEAAGRVGIPLWAPA